MFEWFLRRNQVKVIGTDAATPYDAALCILSRRYLTFAIDWQKCARKKQQ